MNAIATPPSTPATLPAINRATLPIDATRQTLRELGDTVRAVRSQLSPRIIGLTDEITLVLAATFIGGHISLEGRPGTGKTMLARGVAECLGLDFKRIQFTPDLVPSDITGSNVLDRQTGQFAFRAGPIFASIVLADEINRSGPKTQSALLEAMAERQVSYDGQTYKLPSPHLVIATQNPMESQGTYPLPDAQLDRFLIKLKFRSPNMEEMKQILQVKGSENGAIAPLFTPDEARRKILEYRALIRQVEVSPERYDDMVQLLAALSPESTERTKFREVEKYVESGPSPRGAEALQALARTYAALDGRMLVQREDIIAAAIPTLAHRIALKPTAVGTESSAEGIIKAVMTHLFRS
jgi:MoxR-like ATPase